MNDIDYIRQKWSTGSIESTGSHGFHGSKLVYRKSLWKYWVQFGMLALAVATGIWIRYWVIVGCGLLGICWLVGDMLSMPYDTIQITEERIILLRKHHIYREYILQAQNSITLKITRHFREYVHYYRLTMHLHNVTHGHGRGSTVIKFKHFVNSGHQGLQDEVQEIKTFLETMANQQVDVKESFSLLQ